MYKGSTVHGEQAEQAAGSGQSGVQVSAGGVVDLGKLVSSDSNQSEYVSDYTPSMAISENGRIKIRSNRPSFYDTLAEGNRSAASLKTKTTTTPDRDSAPVTASVDRVLRQPAMHPGAGQPILNPESKKTSNEITSDATPRTIPSDTRATTKFRAAKETPESTESNVETVSKGMKEAYRRKGLDEIRGARVVESQDVPNTVPTRRNRTFKKIKEIVQDKVIQILKGKNYSRDSFYEKIVSMSGLMPHCVSLGTENLTESLRDPDSGILELVNWKLSQAQPEAKPLTLEECLENIDLIVDAINSLNIEVTLDKTPVNIAHSIQVRTLRIHHGRGIGLHPTQTKGFNADFDGDPAALHMDQSQLMQYARAMDRLVSADGEPLLDPAYFPLEPIGDKKLTLEILKEKYFSWLPQVANYLIDSYVDVCNKQTSESWVSFLRKIDEISDRYSKYYAENRNEITSAILKTIYDFSIDMRGLSIQKQLENMPSSHSNYNPPTSKDPFILALVDMTDEIIAGRPPMSLMEFTKFYHRYYGDIRDSENRTKNVPFRMLGDYANAINRTDLITIGSDLFGYKLNKVFDENGNPVSGKAKIMPDDNSMISIYDLWQFTTVASLTKMISGRCHTGSRQLAVSTQVRKMVLKDCPVPQASLSKEEFRDWISNFKTSYNFNMKMLQLAEISFRWGMEPIRGASLKYSSNRIGDNYENLADALVKVYGQFTVGRMFPSLIRATEGGKENSNSTIAKYYRNMPLDKFVMNNRLVFRNEGKESKFTKINERLKNNEFDQMDVLLLIADRRSKQLGEYQSNWLDVTADQFGKVGSILKYSGQDLFEYSDDVLETIQLMSPDMFFYFGMESPTKFEKSKWGKKLINAESLDEYRNVLFSMMIDYRLGRASSILSEIDSLNKEVEVLHSVTQEHTVKKLETLDAAFESELEVLGSSSMVWHTIVNEMMNGNAVFTQLKNSGGTYNPAGTIWHMFGKEKTITLEDGSLKVIGKKFWDRSQEEKEKYHTLVDFLKSSEPIDIKFAVLADVTRVSERFPNMSEKEILGQIAHNPDKLHAGGRFEMDKGIRGAIDSLKESKERLSSYSSSSIEKIANEAQDIISEALRDKQAFQTHLTRMANEPGYAVYVDPIFTADAIASVFDKNYNDKEKTKQQPSPNGNFGCLSYQYSGGYFTHLYMSDNNVVNTIGFDQITGHDIVKVLADPSLEITLYDEYGTPETISRGSLCGGNSIDDVIDYLTKNPRIALLCQRQIAGIGSDILGTARVNSLKSKSFGDTTRYRIFSLFNDRPRFLAIAGLISPSDNEVGRNMPSKVEKSLGDLCDLLAYESISGLSKGELKSDIARKLRLSKDKILRLKKQGSFDETEITKDDEEYADNLYNDVLAELVDCVYLLRKAPIYINPKTKPPLIDNSRIDQSSVISYFDAKQQLSGSRTGTMLSVEGSETKKNLALKEYLKSRPDVYTMSEDGLEVVLVGSQDSLSDQSLVRDNEKKTNSLCKLLEIKRERGAETYNAKYKKYGDDGTNSIIKFIRFAKRSVFNLYGKKESAAIKDGTWAIEDAADLRRRILSCNSKQEAVPILVEALINADIRLGYIDVNKETGNIEDNAFIPSDYWNKADLMLAENSNKESGNIVVIRTIEQLSAACRSRLSNEAIVSGDPDLVYNELDYIVNNLGTDRDNYLTLQEAGSVSHNCLYGISLHNSISKIPRIDRALRPRSSSTERNYLLLYRIYSHYKNIYGMDVPSREDIIDISEKAFARYKRKANKETFSTVKSLIYPKDKWISVATEEEGVNQKKPVENPKGNRDYIYDLIGIYDDEDIKWIPGPQSLVIFNGGWDPKERKVFESSLKRCEEFGITALFEGNTANMLPESLQKNLILIPTSDPTSPLGLLPFFDIALNGMFGSSIMPAPTQTPFNPDNIVINVEDTTFSIKPGDSTYHRTKALDQRVNLNFPAQRVLEVEQLFANTLATYPTSDYDIDYCSNEEIQKYVINAEFNPETCMMEGFDNAVIDLGILPKIGGKVNPRFEREVARFNIRLQEYKNAFASADGDSFLSSVCKPDSIIGFVKMNIAGFTVIAPVWPFHLEESGKVPTRYVVKRDLDNRAMVTIDRSTDSIVIETNYAGGLDGQWMKAFEGSGNSTKMIAFGEPLDNTELECGLYVDGFLSTETIGSRLFPSNKRIATMISMMLVPKMKPEYGYNFAELVDSFPDNPTIEKVNEQGETTEYPIKDSLLDGSLSIADWAKINTIKGIRYSSDQDIDNVVRWFVTKCVDPENGYGTVNPTCFLATRTRNGVLWPTKTEYEAFFDTGYSFQNALMKLMHVLSPKLVPESITSNSDDCLFIPVTDDTSEDYGVLQMRVPYKTAYGDPYKKLANVYFSEGFFSKEFSGFNKVSFNAYRRSLDNLNVATRLKGDDLIQLLTFARSGIIDVAPMSGLEALPDNAFEEKKSENQIDEGDILDSEDLEEHKYV